MAQIGTTAGITLGGTAWLIVLGIAVKSQFIIMLPILFGALCIFGSLYLYHRYPERKFAINGAAILWLIVWNSILANALYDKIPDSVGGITTGKNQFSLAQVNVILIALTVLGMWFLIKDIMQKNNT